MLSSFCQAQDIAELKKRFVISHASHPDIDHFNSILEKVYNELGFKVEFIPVPTKMGLMLVIAVIVDADSVRSR